MSPEQIVSFGFRVRQPSCQRAGTKANIDRWEKGFTALSRFHAREGHCHPPRRHVEGKFKLGQWVSVQRYRVYHVPAERRRRLDAIGFVWDFKDYRWEQGFAVLLKF